MDRFTQNRIDSAKKIMEDSIEFRRLLGENEDRPDEDNPEKFVGCIALRMKIDGETPDTPELCPVEICSAHADKHLLGLHEIDCPNPALGM